jgi:uncharacterized protein (DUF58 family)
MELRELNYILIPQSPDTIERFERSTLGRLLRPLLWMPNAMTREGRIVAVVMLVSAAAGMDVRFSNLYIVACALCGVLFAGLVGRRFARLDGVSVWVEHPARATVGSPVEFAVHVRNDGPRAVWALRVRGPFLPWDGTWEGSIPSIPVLQPGEETRVVCAARFDVRGERNLGRFDVASVRPLLLFAGRRLRTESVKLTLVPRVRTIGGAVGRRAAALYQTGRVRASALAGESFDLLGVRPYRVGDRLRDLHARSWARAGEPMVREYRQEQFERVGVVLHGQGTKVARERFDAALEVTAGLVDTLKEADALVDVVLLSDPPAEARAGRHTGSLEAILDLLAVVQPAATVDQAMTLLDPHLGRWSAVYLVTLGWDAAQQETADLLRAHGARVELLVVPPAGPLRRAERERPPGAAVVRPGEEPVLVGVPP